MTLSKLAISNLAWRPEDDGAVADVLRAARFTGVEIAPTKRWPNPLEATPAQVAEYRKSWADRGLRIVALQALLYGRPDLRLFDAESRPALHAYLLRIIDLAAGLGARALVFGSPKNRQRGELPLARALGMAADFFRPIAARAQAADTVICVEPNPPDYGCDFITTTADAVALCQLVDHPGLRVQGDLGAITMVGDRVEDVLATAAPFIEHFHVSEPNLVEVGTDEADVAGALASLSAAKYRGWVSIEMRETTLDGVRRAVQIVGRASA